MWTGIYGKYPDQTYLTDEDKRLLIRSPFFFYANGDPVVKPAKIVEKYVHSGGHFAAYAREQSTEWVEAKADGSAEFRFVETKRDKDWIQLFDASRKMMLRLPVGGGPCSWSTDEGQSWHRLYDVVGPK